MSGLNISEYAKRNTVPNQPIQKKIVQAYLESLLNSTNIQSIRRSINPSMIPTLGQENKLAFLNALSRDISLFQKPELLRIISYSLGRKDLNLFEMISDTYFTGYVVEGSSSHVYGGYYPFTDMSLDEYTDTNTLSDMDTSTPIVNFYNKYYDSEEEYNLFLEKVGCYLDNSSIQSYDELTQGISDASKLLTITKPTRVNVSFINIPLIFVGATELGDGHGFAYGITLDENPFDVGANLDVLKNIDPSAFINYHSDVTSIQCIEDAIDTFFLDVGDATIIARFCYTERVSRPQDSSGNDDPSKIWGKVSTTCSVGDTIFRIEGRIDSAKLQDTLQNYAFWFVTYLPK